MIKSALQEDDKRRFKNKVKHGYSQITQPMLEKVIEMKKEPVLSGKVIEVK